ncbi:ABC transporter substrate-binding protein [Mahella australiensis]|uniref:Extracellular solute-binding protein family 5 n=1 Tax=Mahella australiensis (strain DSM 15567 / CIP 107919 / 50-1 BON) TaxID=697281 RepID=F3ZYH1_MAHA5|nr:ABC transporter substrate-binding protein [Mahella australiensis]AEE96713.1 extracellular solute-binding protein family 5 [Mahella australiensis 50-1 BON]
MKRTIKILAMALAVIMLLSVLLVGCGTDEKDSQNADQQNNASEPTYEELVAKLPTIKFLADDGDVAQRDAQAFQEMWKRNLGINVEIETTTFKNRRERMQSRDYQIVYAGWSPDYNDPMTFMDLWITGSGLNEADYSNPQYDELIDKAKKSADNNERMDAMMEAEKILMEDMPIGPIYFRYRDYVKKPEVKDEVRRYVGSDLDLYWTSVDGKDTINLNLGSEPPQMDPQLTDDAVSMQVINGVFEGLTRMDKEGKAMPGMAEKWDVSPDGMNWTFHLRDAKWSNGDPVTAQDFEYAWKRALNPDTGAGYAYIMYPIKNAEAYNTGKITDPNEVGVKALDAKTLEVTLELPTPYFDTLTSFATYMPLNQKFYESVKDKYGSEAKNLIYNGPWTISEWTHESKMVLKKNPDYWNASAIKLNTINYVMINDNTTSVNMFLSGQLDMTGLRGDQRDQLKNEGYELLHFSDGSSWYLEFNTKDPVMQNAKIRKALTYALDRNLFVKNVLMNDSKPALGYVPDVMPGKGGSGTFRKENGDLIKDNNQEEAKKLLIEGIKELGLDK